jgi:PhnB protein
MTARVKGIPDNSSVVIPRLFCRDPAAEIDFCTHTFGAVELGRRPGPGGKLAHALLTVGPAMIMIESEWPSLPSRAPKPDGSSPVVIFVYVEDVDHTIERGISHGAQLLVPAMNQFWGDRTAWIMDPAGHVWTVATRIEEPTEPEMAERWARMLAERSDA